jgi:hypothetical protein
MTNVLANPRVALALAVALLVLTSVPLELDMERTHLALSASAVLAGALIPLACLRAHRSSPTSRNNVAAWLTGAGYVTVVGYVVLGQRQSEFDASIGAWVAAPVAIVAVVAGTFLSEQTPDAK